MSRRQNERETSNLKKSMILDLHVHTRLSGDAKPTAADYAERALRLKRNYDIDGFVITEHRYWSAGRDEELAELSAQAGLVIFQGVELETDYGHILVYGVTPEFASRVDMENRTNGEQAMRAAYETGGFPVPAHPFRPMLGAGIALRALDGLRAIEHLNGGNTPEENEQAERWMKELGVAGTGGSDAHYERELGACMTAFDNPFRTEAEFIKELKSGNYRAIYLKDAKRSR